VITEWRGKPRQFLFSHSPPLTLRSDSTRAFANQALPQLLSAVPCSHTEEVSGRCWEQLRKAELPAITHISLHIDASLAAECTQAIEKLKKKAKTEMGVERRAPDPGESVPDRKDYLKKDQQMAWKENSQSQIK